MHLLKDGAFVTRGSASGCPLGTTNAQGYVAWNGDEAFNFDDGESCVFASDFIQSGENDCALEVHPNDDESFADNYIGDESLYDDDGELLPHIFIENAENNQASVLLQAENFYNDVGGINPDGIDPQIFLMSSCEWDNIIPHVIDNITLTIGENSFDVEVDEDDNNIINVELTEDQMASTNLDVTMTYKFINPDNDADDPTFANSAVFEHRYVVDNLSITEDAADIDNPFPGFYANLNFDWGDDGIEDVALVYSLKIVSQGVDYFELEETVVTIKFALPEDGVLLGDLNGDGVLNIIDVVALCALIQSGSPNDLPSPVDYPAADLNGDGAINVLDVVLLVNLILYG